MLIRRGNGLAAMARRNRLEIIRAGLSRRDLFKMGLLAVAFPPICRYSDRKVG